MIPLSYCGFLCLGLVLTLLGANQDYLAADLELDLARTGMLASALALGLLVGTVGAGPLYDRLPRKPIFVAAILLPATALFGFGSDLGFREALFRFAWIGLGAGAYDTLFIAAIAERCLQNRCRCCIREPQRARSSARCSLPQSLPDGIGRFPSN